MYKKSEIKNSLVVGVDAGSEVSALVVLKDTEIDHAEIASNAKLYDIIKSYDKVGVRLRVAIEDVKPYKAQISPEIIATCKYLGQLEWRLKTGRISHHMIGRGEVKRWVFDKFPKTVQPMVVAQILKKVQKLKEAGEPVERLFKADGITLRDPTSVWVNDSIVIAAMRVCWDIPKAEAFESNRYGISSHMWQALAVASYYVAKSNGWKPTVSKRQTRLTGQV